MLDIVGLSPSPAFFYKPAPEIGQLRKRVRDKQMSSKEYTDRKRGAKVSTFRTGDFVRVKNPHVSRTGHLSYSEALKIAGKKGSTAFTLEDNNTWNAARLSKVPYTGHQGGSTLPTTASVVGDRYACIDVLPEPRTMPAEHPGLPDTAERAEQAENKHHVESPLTSRGATAQSEPRTRVRLTSRVA
ncbi:hypothetical protein HPB49_012627 [Dermacentor silvarum]|uniref:Uncharacterized protein n=1 Tax=Dermacentor silvarum TaxID=543639 RepID=A0ACB8D5H2_DERSI|nr:hypothetical protein HPB49_012627 [Dermacentor silvarum]